MHITTHNAFIFHSFGHLGLCLFIISNMTFSTLVQQNIKCKSVQI